MTSSDDKGGKVSKLQTDMALHHARLADSLAALSGGLNSADSIFANGTQWMEELNTLASIGGDDAIGAPGKGETATYDVAIFGPELKSEGPRLGSEVRSVLLAKERDFTDAIINLDRDNFTGSAFDCAQRDLQVFRTVCAGIYKTNRHLFVHAMPIDEAMGKAVYYRMLIRHIRSQLYVADLLSESVDKLAERIYSLEVVKDKYEAAIVTLRRQLDDYHRAFGGVGRNAQGELVPYSNSATSAGIVSPMESLGEQPCAFVVVQVEELGNLRVRQRKVIEEALSVLKRTLVQLGNSFEGLRTNYHDENEKKEAFSLPDAFMMRFDRSFAAIAFATTFHLELNAAAGLWPQQLTEMTRFSKDPMWKGLRVRIGVHFGVPAKMDGPMGATVQHYEGAAVDKSIRVASKGVAGDTCVSSAAWAEYAVEKKDGRVPPSKKFQHLRNLVVDPIDCGKDIGFKVGEQVSRVWIDDLSARKEGPVDVEFSPISFFGIELSQVDHEEAAPTTEELLNAKDTELTIAQQEMDKLKLAVIKRDGDMQLLREEMQATLSSLRDHMSVRAFQFEQSSESLETQLMTAHDALSAIPATAYKPAVDAESANDVDKRRRERFVMWEGTQDSEPSQHSLSKVDSFRTPKHKNLRLWKRLNGLVDAAAAKTADVSRSSKGPRPEEAEAQSPLFRVHRVIRTFALLVKQFVAEENVADSDNQNINEDQFISLFLRMTQDGVVGSHREVFQQKGFAAIESDDVEDANIGDDNRLSRSVVGHLVRLFNILKVYRLRNIVDINRQDLEKEAPIPIASKQQKKGGKIVKLPSQSAPSQAAKGPLATSINQSTTKPMSDEKETQRLWKEVTELQFKLASANESLRRSEEKVREAAKIANEAALQATKPFHRVAPTREELTMSVPRGINPPTAVPSADVELPRGRTILVASKATQIPEMPLPNEVPEGGLRINSSLGRVAQQMHSLVPETIADHILEALEERSQATMEATSDEDFTERNVVPSQEGGFALASHLDGGGGGDTALHLTFQHSTSHRLSHRLTPREHEPAVTNSSRNGHTQNTLHEDVELSGQNMINPHADNGGRLVAPRPADGISHPLGAEGRGSSLAGRSTIGTSAVASGMAPKSPSGPLEPLYVGGSALTSSSRGSVTTFITKSKEPSSSSASKPLEPAGVRPVFSASSGALGMAGAKPPTTADAVPSDRNRSSFKGLISSAPSSEDHKMLGILGHGAGIPSPSKVLAPASLCTPRQPVLEVTVTNSPLALSGHGFPRHTLTAVAVHDVALVTDAKHEMLPPAIRGKGILNPVGARPSSTPCTAGAGPQLHEEDRSGEVRGSVSRRHKINAGEHGSGELQFAMNHAENQAVIRRAEEERDAYMAKQERLQKQLAELRELQQISCQHYSVPVGGRTSDTTGYSRQFVPFGGVELKPQSRHSKKV